MSSPKEMFNRRAIATSSDDLVPQVSECSSYYFMDNRRTAGWAEVHSGGRVIELDTARSVSMSGRKEKMYSTTISVGAGKVFPQ